MELSEEQIRHMAAAIGLEIPDDELEAIRHRLSGLLTALEAMQAELGEEMGAVDPIPPVYPHEEF